MNTGPMRALGALAAVAVLGVAGCGGGDDGGTTSNSGATAPETTAAAAPVSGSTTIKMNEFNFIPKELTATAGQLKVTAPNEGKVVHELVLAKTDLPADGLPTNSSGEVSESKLDTVGEIADVDPGKSKSTTFDLKAGRYVMFCNLPGHYKGGMYGVITVK